MRAGWTIRSSGRSWTRTWRTGSTVTPIRSAGRSSSTTAYFHTPDGLAGEIDRAGFTGTAVYGVEGPGWPLRREWADPRRREQILFAARSVETQPSLIGFSDHLIAAAARP
jgi:hypothetical protein